MYLKEKLVAGYVLTCLGDRGGFTYKKSRQENSLADRAAAVVLRDKTPHQLIPFFPDGGSDERQYCSPGFDLPVGSIMRTMYGKYPEYHTSLDNLDLVSPDGLQGSYDLMKDCIELIEKNEMYKIT